MSPRPVCLPSVLPHPQQRYVHPFKQEHSRLSGVVNSIDKAVLQPRKTALIAPSQLLLVDPNFLDHLFELSTAKSLKRYDPHRQLLARGVVPDRDRGVLEEGRHRVDDHLLPDVQFVVGVHRSVGQFVEHWHLDPHVQLVLSLEGKNIVDVLVGEDGQVGVAVGGAPVEGELGSVGRWSGQDGDLEVRFGCLAPAEPHDCLFTIQYTLIILRQSKTKTQEKDHCRYMS